MPRTVTWLTPVAQHACDTGPMNEPRFELQVASDDYRIVTDDVTLSARLHSSLVVCLYDAVEEHGALMHLRLAAPGHSQDPNLTDNTLSSDLALLDRALRELAAASPRAQHWQAKLVAHTEEQASARVRCEGLQAFIGAFLQDAGIKVISSMAHADAAVSVQFRPSMGQVRTQAGAPPAAP
jgi:chemotaxis receptor (MCP) glutamine deamidase CheD